MPATSRVPPEASIVLPAKVVDAPLFKFSVPVTARFPPRLSPPAPPISSSPFAPTLPPVIFNVPPLTSMLMLARFKLPREASAAELLPSSRFLAFGTKVSKVSAASLLRVRSLSSSRSAWFSVRVPPVLVKLLPTASVVFSKSTAAPLILMPSAKLNFPPVEVIVVPMFLAKDGVRISSTRIKNSEIDSDGNLLPID